MTIHDTLTERQNTHGDFHENAMISRTLKETMHEQPGWRILSPVQREALDVIQAKIARILSGNPNEPDHWHDIGGYASLAERDIEEPDHSVTCKCPICTGLRAVIERRMQS